MEYGGQRPSKQYQGGFDWVTTDPTTGVATAGSVKCKIILLVGAGAQVPSPVNGVSPSDVSDPQPSDEPQASDIVVSGRTKTIVIGVGCAVGALVLAGFVGFYYIRFINKRAADEQISRKLREPIQTGPLFPPMDRNGGGAGKAARYNELTSITTASVSMGSPATMRTEMVELGAPAQAHFGSNSASPSLGSRSPTPIAAAHAKLSGSPSYSPSLQSAGGQERPGSLLTSSFVPYEQDSRSSSPHKNPFEKRENHQQYEHELHLQQQHQLQQQQQQQQQSYGSYPY